MTIHSSGGCSTTLGSRFLVFIRVRSKKKRIRKGPTRRSTPAKRWQIDDSENQHSPSYVLSHEAVQENAHETEESRYGTRYCGKKSSFGFISTTTREFMLPSRVIAIFQVRNKKTAPPNTTTQGKDQCFAKTSIRRRFQKPRCFPFRREPTVP